MGHVARNGRPELDGMSVQLKLSEESARVGWSLWLEWSLLVRGGPKEREQTPAPSYPGGVGQETSFDVPLISILGTAALAEPSVFIFLYLRMISNSFSSPAELCCRSPHQTYRLHLEQSRVSLGW